jgi:tRNA dimethylallyltransferase
MIALIGPTASGKSGLALKLALKYGYEILSLDSLSIYKEIDIASAKPTKEELSLVKHYGVDEIYPDEKFNVQKFIDIYQKIKDRKIIIVGGTSFYLKSMISGLSPMPKISKEIEEEAKKYSWEFLYRVDSEYASKIKPQDSYRVQKGIELYLATNQPPTLYFQNNPPKPIIENCEIYEIAIERDKLRERIRERTAKMFKMGLIDEVAFLDKKYSRELTPMKAIGVREVLDYFDGVYDREQLFEKIVTNSVRLAKRQQTFNRTQFREKVSLPLSQLEERLEQLFSSQSFS